jgi:hypothetical protein
MLKQKLLGAIQACMIANLWHVNLHAAAQCKWVTTTQRLAESAGSIEVTSHASAASAAACKQHEPA